MYHKNKLLHCTIKNKLLHWEKLLHWTIIWPPGYCLRRSAARVLSSSQITKCDRPGRSIAPQNNTCWSDTYEHASVTLATSIPRETNDCRRLLLSETHANGKRQRVMHTLHTSPTTAAGESTDPNWPAWRGDWSATPTEQQTIAFQLARYVAPMWNSRSDGGKQYC